MNYAIMTTSFNIIIWQFDVPYKVDRPTAINKGRSILIWVSWLTLKMLDSNENLHKGFRAILNRKGKALGGKAFLSGFLFWEKKRVGGGGGMMSLQMCIFCIYWTKLIRATGPALVHLLLPWKSLGFSKYFSNFLSVCSGRPGK